MNQQSSDIRDQKIAQLEARLAHANKVIASLQQQNLDLKKYLNQLEGDGDQQHLLPKEVSTKLSGYRKIIRKSRFSQLSDWQFYGLTSSVVMLILFLFVVFTSLNNRTKDQNVRKPQVSTKPHVSPNSVSNLSLPKNSVIDISPIPQAISEQPITSGTDFPSENYPELSYNVIDPPNLQKSETLNKIVKEVIKLVKEQNLPLENLSITLIDMNKQTISGYKEKNPRYPASVVKLFWMVVLESKIKQHIVLPDININSDLEKMILKSDNNAASRIVDCITHAQSLPNKLEKDGFAQWKQQRESLNTFFLKANYRDINISQKTFPIPDLKTNEPQGTDLQIRGNNLQKPIRNKITTYDAARLMYEIATNQAVSGDASQRMLTLLTRDLRPEAWKLEPPNPDEFNPVEDFLGEGLANQNVKFASKAGWTNTSRQEVAYVTTLDGSTRYVLAIFGDNPAYGQSKTIFPQISKLVFNHMKR